MSWRRCLVGATLLAGTLLGACNRAQAPAAPPAPVEVTADATGHYCGMLLVNHEGPKGQVLLASRAGPVWFSSVRDTLAFLRLPEEPRDVAAVYVNDMGRSGHWEQPDAGAWVDPRQAWFVIESDLRGGMGAPEAVPFSDRAAAQNFQGVHKGRIVRLAEIPDAYVLGPVDLGNTSAPVPASGASGGTR